MTKPWDALHLPPELSQAVITRGAMVKRRKPRKDAVLAWQEANPLRLWRLQQPPEGWNRSVLARQIGVSPTAVESWEKGKKLPVIDSFAKIEALTGITTRQWMDWFNHRPEDRS